MKEPSIYFIRPIGAEGPIKIGCSQSPEVRLASMMAWSPLPLEIIAQAPGNLQDEDFIHRCFSGDHSHGEWFHPSPKLLAFVDTVKQTGTVNAVKSMTPAKTIRKTWHNGPRDKEIRRRASYTMRITWAEKKLRERFGDNAPRHAPDDVKQIMSDWAGEYGAPSTAVLPNAKQIERLEEFLAEPSAHAVLPIWDREEA